jgi:protoheme IX farnesyltransferase
MLPVVVSLDRAARQIFLYTLALVAVTLAFIPVARMGLVYIIATGVLDVVFVGYALRLWRVQTDEAAMAVFRYSITYLTLLFVAVAVDVVVRYH